MTGQVDAIWTAREDSAPMESVETIRAVPGGLEGDRYLTGEGFYSPYDVCEVTFIAGEDIDRIAEEVGIDLSDGRHRRNVVTRGVDLHDLLESRFRVGDAVFEGTRPRPPCRHVEEVAEEAGVMQALKGKGGICADVETAGEFSVGDEIAVVEDRSPDPDGLAATIEERRG